MFSAGSSAGFRPGLPPSDAALTEGVLGRRLVAWVIDACIIGVLVAALWVLLLLLGLMTLGLGLPLLGLLPCVPVAYGTLALVSPVSATPGQAMLGLSVRRNDDLGPPDLLQAFATTALFYVTWWGSAILQLFAILPIASRRRMLHDVLSGTVVVHARALTAARFVPNMAGADRMGRDWPVR